MRKLTVLAAALLMLACNNPNKTENQGTTPAARNSSETSKPVQANNNSIELPAKASAFISEHFGTIAINKIEQKQSPSSDGTMFEVKLADGTELDFDKDGNWTEISVEVQKNVPLTAIPTPIQEYLKANYANIAVEVLDKEPTGYELELANDVDLYFDLNGKFIRQEK